MGVDKFYPFLRKHGYEAAVIPQGIPPHTAPRRLVDVLGSIYGKMQDAYTRHDPDTAHTIVENAVSKIAHVNNSVLFLDGSPCVEKDTTRDDRNKKRKKAHATATTGVTAISARVDAGKKVRKQAIKDVEKAIKSSFCWTIHQSELLASYLRQRGWTVIVSDTESDVQIARCAKETDEVVTVDSDLLVYGNVRKVLRPISKDRFLVFIKEDILRALGLSSDQFTVLGVVSKNDYTKNVHSLGCHGNWKILKNLAKTGNVHDPYV